MPPLSLLLRGLTKDYGSLRAVDALDLDVPEGSVYGFLGPNGAGKTTTIRMILGLIRPTAGHVQILGEPVDRPSHPVLAQVGALVEQPAFYRHLSGRANLELFARSGPEPSRPRRERIDGVLETVGLADAAGRKLKAYSHGMRQRLGVAQALLNDPRLVVLDEPTDGLDPQGIRETRALLRSLVADDRTVFLSSHLLHEVEQVCDHVAVINHGRLVAAGPVAEIRGAESLRLHTLDLDRAREVVAAMGGECAVLDGTLSIRLGPTLPEELVRRLVEDGVRVRALVPERAGLEDVYFQLVGP